MRKQTAVLVETLVLASLLAVAACHRNYPVTPPTTQVPEVAPAPPGPPTCNLTAEPAAVEQGQSITLSWTSTDATTVDIEPGVGKQLSQGSAAASPQTSTTYILTASGPGGEATCTARVTVTGSTAPSVSEENLNPGGGEWSAQLQDAFFDYDSADLRQDARAVLSADASILKAHPGAAFTVEGYCDQRGSEEYNLGLGQRRASAARDFLVSLGLPVQSLATVSYGKDRLVCTETSDDCWQRNRRVHLARK
jgi:peptidoglycan-associated lipoprotein